MKQTFKEEFNAEKRKGDRFTEVFDFNNTTLTLEISKKNILGPNLNAYFMVVRGPANRPLMLGNRVKIGLSPPKESNASIT